MIELETGRLPAAADRLISAELAWAGCTTANGTPFPAMQISHLLGTRARRTLTEADRLGDWTLSRRDNSGAYNGPDHL